MWDYIFSNILPWFGLYFIIGLVWFLVVLILNIAYETKHNYQSYPVREIVVEEIEHVSPIVLIWLWVTLAIIGSIIYASLDWCRDKFRTTENSEPESE